MTIVDTEYGPVEGIRKMTFAGRDYVSFQGIPYMKPPLGKLRFREAQPPEKWTEPFDATKPPPAYMNVYYLTGKLEGQEDAGVINVYKPHVEQAKPLPVMVFIHGGGFTSGSSRTDLLGPDYYMQKDVVLVTFNYRLGVIGFLSLKDPKLGIPGNQGLKDQVFALKWVKRNIANFGGDPDNITLFGQSVSKHLFSENKKF